MAGEQGAPLVILLHGFPEFWFSWRDYFGPLVRAGYRVVAPDQRGYNLSDKPRKVGAYKIDRLAEDVLELARWEGAESFRLVGHDWGAAVAWRTAQRRPQAIDRMVQDAQMRGADAVICLRVTTSMIMGGSAELLAYGTAVRLS